MRRQLRCSYRLGWGEQAVSRNTRARRHDRHQAGAADAAAAVAAVRTDHRWHGVRSGRSSVQRSAPGSGRRQPDRPRGGVLALCWRTSSSSGFLAAAGVSGGAPRPKPRPNADLAGNGSQRNAARRRRRVHGGISWCSQRTSPVLVRWRGCGRDYCPGAAEHARAPVRTPVCRRPLWRKTRTTTARAGQP